MMHPKRFALAFALSFGLATACTVDGGHARHILESAGYTKINLGGHAWYACSDDDSRSTEFTAIGPTGQRVKGAVCCGLWAKNCTIRLD